MTDRTPAPLVLDEVRLGLAEMPTLAFTLESGEALVVFGPDGCGKSTLIRICAGVLAPVAGRVLLFGRDVAALRRAELAGLHRRTGVVFEDGALIARLTVEENVALPLAYRGGMPRRDRRDRVGRCLAEAGMTGLAARSPAELTPGERRRAALARALAFGPELLLFDDPTKGLDAQAAAEIVAVIARVRDRSCATMLVASGDVWRLKDLASRVGVLHRGEPLRIGRWDEVAGTDEVSWLDWVVRSSTAPSAPADGR